jgi:uncharacterized protein (TIGR00369 family)
LTWLAQVLPFAEKRLPRLAPWLKKRFVELAVPANRAVGLRIGEVTADSGLVVVTLPPRRRNENVGGTIHGGVLLALAETVHGIAVLWQFSPARHTMVSKESRIEFVAPARGELSVRFGLDPGTRQRIADELERSGRSEVQLASVVRDAAGHEVARLFATYVVQRRPRPVRIPTVDADA